jgi:hypothetical protein
MTAFILRGEKIEINCPKDDELRDNNFNPGGLDFWHGTGQMHSNDQFEAEAIEAVSQPEYFALQKFPNRTLSGPPISFEFFFLPNRDHTRPSANTLWRTPRASP